ncbi:hypothetical protein C4B63_47g94 [Trypanosoma cruzi]|uniref:Myosin motor domain-containing protein n=1 Tax=Trypanosoma cruzi TaxID=5693 RepID=A0A2V2V2V1_TRYCR|nr:hypothetical protein C4B63_47g94 [Trypanosoma cruzi]
MPAGRIGTLAVCFTPVHHWVVGKITNYDPRRDTYSFSATEPEFINVDHLPRDSSKLWFPKEDALNDDFDDLLNLVELHEASVLFCLKKRYLKDVVYTNIGPILVALNPFNYFIPAYVEAKMEEYLSEGSVIEKNLPHPWATAHNAYRELRESGRNQTILISGESGAGKTEAAKIVLKYLAALSTKNGTPEDRELSIQINKRVLASSPILESFGNAKTIRNDNSSRFGKFLRVQFDKHGILVGCHVTKYLLEKSRIIGAAKGERVYHSFYQLVQGPLAKEFSLRNPKVYRILNAGECINIDGVDDAVEYASTRQAMDDVGITEEEQMSIWSVVAGVVFLQNTDFVESEERAGLIAKMDSNLLPVLARACQLWGINEEEFMKELISTCIVTQKEQTVKPLNKVQALDMRDSVCKSLYVWLFDWLVLKINQTTNREAVTTHWIGLLDIFGFENFQKNSFEQLCINLANEALQGHYNQHIFTLDMQECQNEGIDTTHVTFADNKECVDLLMGKVGVFTLLDEECAVSGNETRYLHKLMEKFAPTKGKSGNAHFLRATGRAVDNHFIIRHYAADVQYNVEGFLDKNRDTLKERMKHIFMQSKVALIPKIIPKEEIKTNSKGTVGGLFIKQLLQLLAVINQTNPHWIRCVKPNAEKQCRRFSDGLVLQQLRSAGVLETVRIRKAGYPIRFKYDDFLKRYRVLFRNGVHGKVASREIVQNCDIDPAEVQFGETKIFMKHEAYFKLNHRREQAIRRFYFLLQAVGRGSLARGQLFRDYALLHRRRLMEERRIREEALRMQREEEEKRRVREQAERERRESLLKERRHKAAVSIQKVVRGFLSRHKFLMVYLSTLRAREEHSRDDEQQKYRLYEANRHRKMCVLEARRDGQHGPTNTHRRELLRERRERTMLLLEEKRLLHASKLEKEVAHEKAQRAKERVQRRKQMLEMWKGVKNSQKESMDLSGASQIVEKRFFGEMMRKLQGHAKDSNESPTEFSQNVSGDSRYQDSTFDIVKKQWEEKERWKDERERILGPRHEAHGSALTPRQRHLEGQYRIRTVSNVLWQLESKAAALSFQKQQR